MNLVTVLPAQQTFTAAAHESILDAALRAGINLPHSCKSGHCTSCRARILQGQVRYPRGRPLGLLPEEELRGDVLLCQARADGELVVQVREVRRALEVAIKNLPCRIERLRLLAPDVMEVSLRLPANEQFVFLAGQYIDVLLSQNRRRSFSIATPPRSDAVIILHVRRAPGGEFTDGLFTGVFKEKSLLRIEGPLGQFDFREDSPRPALLIGGGTGFAPLRAILSGLLERGDSRPLHLYWGVRSRVDLYEDSQAVTWARTHANFKYTPVLSAPRPEDTWQGKVGWVHAAVLEEHSDLSGFDVYASGPPAMVDAVRSEFPKHGLPAHQLFFDSFDYAPDSLEKLRG